MARRMALPHSGDAPVFPSREPGEDLRSMPDTLPRWVAESAGRAGRADAPSSNGRSGLQWRPGGLGNRTRIVAAAVLVALALPAIATWAFGQAYRASETDRVDARLSASLRVAADSVTALDATAARSARALAESPDVQRALVRGDRAALAGFASREGALSLGVRTAGEPAPKAAPGLVVRSVAVRGATGVLGSVDAVESLPVL